MPIARHVLSLAAVAALTCGLGGAPSGDSAFAESSIGSANRITAVYRVDLAGFNLGNFQLTTVFRGTDYEMRGEGRFSVLQGLIFEWHGTTASKGKFSGTSWGPDTASFDPSFASFFVYHPQGGYFEGGDSTLEQMTLAIRREFDVEKRKQLVAELAPLRRNALEGHPWRHWAEAQDDAAAKGQRLPGATSRWNRGKDLSWEPLRPERVCEVAYDHMQGTRFRHAAQFVRWRPDKRPKDCRYDQLDVTPPYELERVFGARDRGARSRKPRHGS